MKRLAITVVLTGWICVTATALGYVATTGQLTALVLTLGAVGFVTAIGALLTRLGTVSSVVTAMCALGVILATPTPGAEAALFGAVGGLAATFHVVCTWTRRFHATTTESLRHMGPGAVTVTVIAITAIALPETWRWWVLLAPLVALGAFATAVTLANQRRSESASPASTGVRTRSPK
ncbi:hypothetical protein IEU95_15635 [Hoyosella rhizosphaerae]|uniref:Uncharacterized protein n=1 Tax=Hoyosella rhizosphaerae TaxID=1755582 RepID=A0A916XI98_9ACTN|nr:hypothetical protein [Hoyosella rhizosphaerae]MBN4928266.1 hypothetical protein [Hoyosella rhizosphaerae]GGC73678.1 hypothetical protein GCM10011410_28530 [Hoyosella rhizosphaerae]